LTHALRFFPEDRRLIPLSDMGHLEKQRGEFERAAGWYRQAIAADPRHTAGYIFLGAVLAQQGCLREAEEVHRTAIETCYEGCLDEAFLNLGLVLRAQERFEEAAECFREAIRLDPGCRDARKALRDVERCIRMLSRHR
jgi:tetratricopeptide (TPR) repeat protein